MVDLFNKHNFIPEWTITEKNSFRRSIAVNPIGDSIENETSTVIKKQQKEIQKVEANKTVQEKKKEKEMARAQQLYKLELLHRNNEALIEKEIEFFSKSVLSSMDGYTDDEIRINVLNLLNNSRAFSKSVTIYMKNTSCHLKYHDCITVVRRSFIRIIEEATSRIELKHREFPQVEVVKTMSR